MEITHCATSISLTHIPCTSDKLGRIPCTNKFKSGLVIFDKFLINEGCIAYFQHTFRGTLWRGHCTLKFEESRIKVLMPVLSIQTSKEKGHQYFEPSHSMNISLKSFLSKTSQELRMLSSVTVNCQATKIVMNSGSHCHNCNLCLKCHKSLGLSL